VVNFYLLFYFQVPASKQQLLDSNLESSTRVTQVTRHIRYTLSLDPAIMAIRVIGYICEVDRKGG